MKRRYCHKNNVHVTWVVGLLSSVANVKYIAKYTLLLWLCWGSVEARVAWIGSKIRSIRWKFLWEILQSSRVLLQTSDHVSGSTVRGLAVVVLLIKIIGY